ncbi:hypothetical protein NE865_03874 [Phthorimaea operculella]|nr:hypothetical protein NE865_03874 [Phthorimaea operculella]
MSGSKIPGNAGGEVGGSSNQDDRDATQPERTSPVVPAGLKALCEAYSRLYPDQPNPLQVTTRLKYWLGGHDPLDYISMYWNPGKPEENIPPHWHYVSFGLTPHGAVSFIQLVGCTGRELRAAQRGSGFDVLKLMAEDPNCGGSWLVTRMRRRSSARRVRAAGAAGGAGVATLAGVSARMRWEPWTPSPEEDAPPVLSLSVERQIKETLQRGLSTMSTDRTGPEGHTGMSTDSFEMSSIERALPQIPELMQGSWRSGAGGSRAEGSGEGEEATLDRPYVAKGLWLQMMITPELAEEMLQKVSHLTRLGETDSETDSESEGDNHTPTTLPQTFAWPKHRLKISVVPDHQLL